ncbi:MAG: GtrA family protein [Candidatus Aphodosoma sp.]
MHPINRILQKPILTIIDFMYRPFSRVVPYQLFRYGISGCANMAFDWILYFVFYNFIFRHNIIHIGPVAISAHIASFLATFPISFASGFWLSRYISFKESVQRGRVQLIRYLMVVGLCILINYLCLKLFVEALHIYPTPSKMITTVITTIFSFLSQKYFTFKA